MGSAWYILRCVSQLLLELFDNAILRGNVLFTLFDKSAQLCRQLCALSQVRTEELLVDVHDCTSKLALTAFDSLHEFGHSSVDSLEILLVLGNDPVGSSKHHGHTQK